MEIHKTWVAYIFTRKSWPDGDLIYNVSSGNTHVVSSLASTILDRLAQQPSTSVEIARCLAAANDIEVDDEVIKSVDELLANLEALGLVESTINDTV